MTDNDDNKDLDRICEEFDSSVFYDEYSNDLEGKNEGQY